MEQNGEKETSGHKFSGIEFAPVSIPLSRRLETLAALIYITTTFIFPFIFLFLYYWLPYFWHFIIAYVLWLVFDHQTPKQGGRRFLFMRRLPLWRKLRDYFPATLVKTADFDPTKNYLLGYHPHGIVSTGAFINFATEANHVKSLFSGIKFHLLTLDSNFIFPLFRDYILSLGCCSVSRGSMNYLLGKRGGGNAAMVVVGGAREAMYSHTNNLGLHLSSRKGFIKVAIQNGADLVPVFGFGETDIILQVSNPEGSRLRAIQNVALRITGYAPVLFFGRGIFQYTFGILPLRRPHTTVVGAPIPVTKNPNPTSEEVDQLHATYVAALKALIYNNRAKYGYPDLEVTIV